MTYGYKITIEQECLFSEHSEEQWGEWSSVYSNTIDKFFTKEDKHPDVVSEKEFKSGDKAYVVWAVWSTGDSFGHSEDSEVDAIAIFSDPSAAFDFKNQLEIFSDPDDYEPISFETKDGQIIKYYPSWFGYFESLSYIEVSEVVFVETK